MSMSYSQTLFFGLLLSLAGFGVGQDGSTKAASQSADGSVSLAHDMSGSISK
jgi:hypothetical protein